MILFGCSTNGQQNNTTGTLEKQGVSSCDCEIIAIDVLYYNYLFNTARARNWDDLKLNLPNFTNEYWGVLDAKITDCKVLKEINNEMKKLKTKREQSGDADVRIVFTASYTNRTDTILCIGGYFANGLFTKERIELSSESINRLLYLLKNNIGYYSWFDESELEYMDELQDTTFAKEPFIESPYYKKYKEMQEKKVNKRTSFVSITLPI
jgi:hypothetical protein